MSLTKQQIQDIANLARLDVNEQELERYSTQLSDVVDYISKLKEVDITDIEPTAQVTGLESVMREDVIEVSDKNIKNVALNQAAEIEGAQIKVKRILE